MEEDFVPLTNSDQLASYIYFSTGDGGISLGWSPAERAQIFGYIKRAFDSSATFREWVNSYLDLLHSERIYIHSPAPIPFNGVTYDGIIFKDGYDPFITGKYAIFINKSAISDRFSGGKFLDINPSYLANATYVNERGVAVVATLEANIIHELGHLLGGLGDWVHEGQRVMSEIMRSPNVDAVNQVYSDMGIQQRLLYVGFDPTGLDAPAGRDFVHGAHIAGVVVAEQVQFSDGSHGNFDAGGLEGNPDLLLIGGASDNVLTSGGGQDWLYGGGGADTLSGGDGDDQIFGEAGIDRLYGGSGEDKLFADADDIVIDGGDDYDTVDYSGSLVPINWEIVSARVTNVEEVIGSRFDDVLNLTQSTFPMFDDDVLMDGGGGADQIRGSGGDDVLRGGTGNDRIEGMAGDDEIYGGDDNDTIIAGESWYVVSSDDDRVYAGAGDDRVLGGAGADEIYGDSGDDFIGGERGDDRLFGGTGNDLIAGGANDDAINGEGGDDQILGGDGEDILAGGAGADHLIGGSGEDYLYGGSEADTLDGTHDDTTLLGNNYADHLSGGTGDDTFLTNDGDVITDPDRGDQVYFLGARLNGGENDSPPRNPCAPAGDPEEVEDGVFEAADGTTYTLDGTTLTVTSPPGFFGTLFSSTLTIEQFRNGYAGIYLRSARPQVEQAECNRDPLIIDLDGDRNVVRELYDSHAYFDLDNDGFAEHVAWSLGGDGFLVHDRNGNGRIDNGSELFGSGNVQFGGSRDAEKLGTAGFAELATYDTNGDGRISAADADFAALRVWVDANADGLTDDGELKTLDSLGIVSISLRTFVSDDADCGCDGTDVTHMANVTRADGSVTGIYDAYLSIDQYDTRELTDVQVSAEIQALPFLVGSGTLSDLDVAMARDPALEAMVREFSALEVGDAARVTVLVESIILRWTGADTVAPDSRGESVNARWLVALEKISGSEFAQFGVGRSPRDDAAAILNSEWQDVVRRVTAQLLGQTELGQVITPGLSFASAAFHVVADDATSDTVLTAAASHAPSDRAGALTYWHSVVSAILPYRGDLSASETGLYWTIDHLLPGGTLPIGAGALAGAYIAGSASEIAVGTTAFTAGPRVISGDDVLIALPGATELIGAGGNDTYVVAHAVGAVSLVESGGADDTLMLFDWQQENTLITAHVDAVKRSAASGDIGLRLTVRIGAIDSAAVVTTELALVGGRFEGIETLAFDDDVRRDIYDLLPPVLQLPDGSGALHIGGATPGAVLAGGAGDDILAGRSAADHYVLAVGGGADAIVERADPSSTGDELFIDALPGDVSFRITGDALQDLTVVLTASGDQVAIAEQWGGSGRALESFRFADGSVLSAAQVQTLLTTGTAADDRIHGTIGADVLDGHGGRDLLEGGLGNDTYIFGIGYGALTIKDVGGASVIDLGSTFTLDNLILTSGSEGLAISFDNSADFIRVAGNPSGTGFILRAGGVDASAGSLLMMQSSRAGTSTDGTIFGTAGNDEIEGTDAGELIDGLGGNDALLGGLGNDTYRFGGGQSSIWDAGFGLDTLLISAEYRLEDIILTTTQSGYGRMRIRISGTDARVDLANGFDYNTGEVDGNGEDDVERILFSDGRSINIGAGKQLTGTSGNDVLFSYSNGSDTFTPGAGDDIIFSINGWQNSVRVSAGFGHDVYYPSANSKLIFEGIDFDDQVSLKRLGSDLLIETGGGADSMLVKGAFLPLAGTPIGELVFEGRTLTFSEVALLLSQATDGDDLLFAGAVMDGGAGNDTMIGTSAANTYAFGRGSGHDVIKEQDSLLGDTGEDTLVLTGLNRDDVTFTRHPTDPLSIVITIKDTGETLTIDGTPFDGFIYNSEDLGFGPSSGDHQGAHWINNIVFADGTTLSQREVEQAILDAERTNGDDTIINFGAPSSGFFGAESGAELDGGAGNDTLVNQFGDVYIRFSPGSGRDVLVTSSEAVVHVRLDGLDPSDVLVRHVQRNGDPYVLLQAKDGSELAIPAALFVNIWISDEDGNSYYTSRDGGLVSQQTGTAGIDYLVGDTDFAPGGEAGYLLPVDETFAPGRGDDVIAGRGGADTVLFDRGDGADRLLWQDVFSFLDPDGEGQEGEGATSAPGYHILAGPGLTRDDLLITWLADGSDNVLLDFGQGDSITVDAQSIASLQFADGTRLEFVSGEPGGNPGSGVEIIDLSSLRPAATGADDTLQVRYGETVDGLGGNDLLLAQAGSTVRFGPGGGHDTLVALPDYDTVTVRLSGITTFDQVEFLKGGEDGGDLVLRIIATGDTLVIPNQLLTDSYGYHRPIVGSFILDGGDALSSDAAGRMAIGVYTGGDDEVRTGPGGGTLDGGAGLDLLRGGTGDDLYRFARGYDEDSIRDAGGHDTIQFGPGISSNDLFFSRAGAGGGNLLIEVIGADRLAMTVIGQFADPAARVETLLFQDGSTINWRDIERSILQASSTSLADVIIGFGSDDVISAKNGNDSITGGSGNDMLDGGAGRDVAVYLGSLSEYEVTTVNGVTTVRDLVAGRDGTDTLRGIESLHFQGGGGADLLLVAANQAPSAGALTRTIAEDTDLLVARADVLAVASDPDGDLLQLSVAAGGSGGRAWIDGNGNIRFRPSANFSGAAYFDYSVSDGNGGVATNRVSVTVTPVNDAPSVAGEPEALVAREDQPFSFSLPGSLFTDIDGDQLQLSVTTGGGAALPQWLTFADGRLTGLAPTDFNGVLALRLVASDGTLTATLPFQLTIQAVNDAPRLVTPFGTIALASGSAVSISVADHFTDPDGDSLQFAVRSADGSPIPEWLAFDGATLSGTAPATVTGPLVIEVAASDGARSTVSRIVLSVPVNHAPQASLPGILIIGSEDVAINTGLPSGSFSDPDGDALTISAVMANGSQLPSWLTFDGDGFTGTPPTNFNGSLAVLLTASDGLLETQAPVELRIASVNDAPQVVQAIADTSWQAGVAQQLTLPPGTFTDVDGDSLTVSAARSDGTPLPSWLSFQASTGTFSGVAPNGTSLSIRVTASDGSTSVSDVFNLTATVQYAGTIYGSAGDDYLYGGAGNDVIDGGAGNDRLFGGAGADMLIGGAGFDWADYTNYNNPMVIDLFDGSRSTGYAYGDVYVGIESYVGSSYGDTFIAGDTATTYDGGTSPFNIADTVDFSLSTSAIALTLTVAGNGFVQGSGAGGLAAGDGIWSIERFIGTSFDDVYTITGPGFANWVSFVEAANGGNDEVRTDGASYTLDSWIEKLTYIGSGDFFGVGNAGNNILTGGAGNDRLTGGAGADILIGGNGFDWANYTTYDGSLVIDLYDGSRSTGDAAGDTYIGIESYVGTGYGDLFIAGATATVYDGGTSPVTLQDTVDFSLSSAAIALTLTIGGDGFVQGSGSGGLAQGDGIWSIERFIGTSFDDVYTVTGIGSTNWVSFVEAAGGGIDEIRTDASGYGLGEELEKLTYIGTGAFTGIGNGLNNVLTGGAGNDRLTGGAGNDMLVGGSGLDVAVFTGAQSDYSIVTSGGVIQIVDNQPAIAGDDGTDTLSGIERAEFQGGVQVALAAPIILDLDGDGARTVDKDVSSVWFDWDADGRQDRTGWVSSSDGFLTLDRNGDGTVSGADELSFINDKVAAKSDFDGLSAFDSNGDHRLSGADDRWSDFHVWRDANGNGSVDQGEYLSMEEAGVSSISLDATATSGTWNWGANIVVNSGSFERLDGTSGGLADVALSYDLDAGNRSYQPSSYAAEHGRFAALGELQCENEARSVDIWSQNVQLPPPLRVASGAAMHENATDLRVQPPLHIEDLRDPFHLAAPGHSDQHMAVIDADFVMADPLATSVTPSWSV